LLLGVVVAGCPGKWEKGNGKDRGVNAVACQDNAPQLNWEFRK